MQNQLFIPKVITTPGPVVELQLVSLYRFQDSLGKAVVSMPFKVPLPYPDALYLAHLGTYNIHRHASTWGLSIISLSPN
jgi:hypothetical protein